MVDTRETGEGAASAVIGASWSRVEGGAVTMARMLLILIAAVIVVLAGGTAYLATRDMPPPTKRIEKVIPNDRFPR